MCVLNHSSYITSVTQGLFKSSPAGLHGPISVSVFEPVPVSLLCVQSCASSCSRILLIRDQQVKRRFRGSMLSDVVQARRKTLNSWSSSNPPCLLSGQFSVLTFHHGGCYVLLCSASTADDPPTSLCFAGFTPCK